MIDGSSPSSFFAVHGARFNGWSRRDDINDSGEDRELIHPQLNANLSANASLDDVEIFRLGVSIDYEFIRVQVIFYTL